jgi:hypothetical protein
LQLHTPKKHPESERRVRHRLHVLQPKESRHYFVRRVVSGTSQSR